ncbi:MAG: radical SAM protein [Candidatus Diapherotrites archaeon]|uniref:Radical SAM protein n=1 Tax=Candidatus Iainarchaeum sp. TaxID=3101447 RepID=A0A8T4LF32_9ARCH|nr:radical SAM protein [Candidatus Diapherotrites archaeon]
MKILMLNPPFFTKFSRSSRSPAISKGGCVYYPLWLGAATGWLEKKGHEVKLLDCPARGTTLDEVLASVNDWKPDLIAVDTVTASYTRDQDTLKALKQALPNSFLVMVGTHCSALPEETLLENKGHLDAICRGEYDFILEELAAALEKTHQPDLESIKGLSFLKGDEVVHAPSRDLITGAELDEFPFMAEVYKKHLHIPDYFYPSVLYPEVTIVTGRGCPFYCTFCILPQVMNGHKYRARSPEHVVAEMKWIKENMPDVKDIMVEDDTFTADRDRIRKVCQTIIEQKLDITWTCNARADVDYETLKLMKDAGCRLMCVGFESADQGVLNNIKKGTVVPKIRQFMKDAKKADIQVHGCFMMGNRGETKETIQKTVNMAIELDPDTVQFFPIMVYPGTEAFRYAEEQGHLTTKDWNHWLLGDGTHNSVISTPALSSDELVRECDKARIRFYSRPKFIFSKFVQMFTSPRDIPRLIKSGWIFSKYYVQELRATWKDLVTKKDASTGQKQPVSG